MIDSTKIMQLVSANIKQLFDSRPGSRIDFARQFYMSPQCVTRLCSQDATGIDFMDILRIATYFGVDLHYFITPVIPKGEKAYEYIKGQ